MDWEAPVDAWYVWIAVSIVSTALAGVVLGLPSGAPPDANQAANVIERVAGSEYAAGGTYEHDADAVRFRGRTIEVSNEHGTTLARFDYGAVVPVDNATRLENLTRGAAFEDEYATELADGDTNAVATFLSEADREYGRTTNTTLTASGDLAVRRVVVDADADGLDPITETVDFKVEPRAYPPGSGLTRIGSVTGSYDGVEGNGLDVTVDGKYTGKYDPTFEESTTVAAGSDPSDFDVEIRSARLGRPAREPVTVTADFESGSCTRHLSLDTETTCRHTVHRSTDLDTDAPFVDYDAETETIHVTLVVV